MSQPPQSSAPSPSMSLTPVPLPSSASSPAFPSPPSSAVHNSASTPTTTSTTTSSSLLQPPNQAHAQGSSPPQNTAVPLPASLSHTIVAKMTTSTSPSHTQSPNLAPQQVLAQPQISNPPNILPKPPSQLSSLPQQQQQHQTRPPSTSPNPPFLPTSATPSPSILPSPSLPTTTVAKPSTSAVPSPRPTPTPTPTPPLLSRPIASTSVQLPSTTATATPSSAGSSNGANTPYTPITQATLALPESYANGHHPVQPQHQQHGSRPLTPALPSAVQPPQQQPHFPAQNPYTPIATPTTTTPPVLPMNAATMSMAPPARLVQSVSAPSIAPAQSAVTSMTPNPQAAQNAQASKEKDMGYDVDDTLAGTGVDIRAEEQYMASLFEDRSGDGYASSAYPSATSSGRHAHHHSSFGHAHALHEPADATSARSHAELVAEEAERAWNKSSADLAASRSQELHSPFLLIALIHQRAEKIAKEHGLSLNLESRPNMNPPLGRMRLPAEFPEPRVQVSTRVLDDSSVVVQTTGSWIPHDASLADQMALLSIASRQRIRSLLEDAYRVAENRQRTSHGEIPDEWQIAAAPPPVYEPTQDTLPSNISLEDVSHAEARGTKRNAASADIAIDRTSKLAKVSTNNVILAIREAGRAEREWEEARLRRRNARKAAAAEASNTEAGGVSIAVGGVGSRAGSVAPGTPGVGGSSSTAGGILGVPAGGPDLIAPETTRPNKKEPKKIPAKAIETSHASQNQTSSMFAGNIFKKRKTKTYDWMNAGSAGGGGGAGHKHAGAGGGIGGGVSKASGVGGGSGGGLTNGAGKGPGALNNMNALTVEGRNRLGAWREDKQRGKAVQLRDWVVALEEDGLEIRALQKAYDALDTSDAR